MITKNFMSNSVLLILFGFFILSLSIVQAAELTFTPQSSTVKAGRKITLSVSGSTGAVTWAPAKGRIEGSGNRVTYLAPNQAGKDFVTVFDEADNTGVIKIVILPKEMAAPVLENAMWEVFTNRNWINTITLADNEKTLWLGTKGGMEQRNAATGQLVRVFTNLDGLPSNEINVLLNDNNQGLWIGTSGGLTYRDTQGKLTTYNTDNSGLKHSEVHALLSDERGGLWIGLETYESQGGLAYRSVDNKWTIHHIDQLPSFSVYALLSDGNQGLWIGTNQGLIHRSIEGEWTIYNADNSGLPINYIPALASDSNEGIWIGTNGAGLVHRSVSGEWTTYNTGNVAELLSNTINTLLSDSRGGLWVGSDWDGLAYRNANNQWMVFNEVGYHNFGENTSNNMYKLPNNQVFALHRSNSDGLWIGTTKGIAYRTPNNELVVYETENVDLAINQGLSLQYDGNDGVWMGTPWNGLIRYSTSQGGTSYTTYNSGLPEEEIFALLRDTSGGLWIGAKTGLAYYSADGKWTVYNTDNSGLPNNVIRAIASDGSDNLWIGTGGGGVVYRSVNGDWTIYDTTNSELPHNYVRTLATDSDGGLWLGTGELESSGHGLARLGANGEWTIYNADNSELPHNDVRVLLNDEDDGLWIGMTNGNLVYRSAIGNWSVYDHHNSELPPDDITALANDGSSGLWIGTYTNGVAHLSSSGDWTFYNPNNSGLPTYTIKAIENDGSNGIWIVGTYGGLAHLSFGQKNTLCTNVDDTDCQTLLTTNRAAILIHPNGSGSGSNQELAVDFMATYAYHTLSARGYDNDEIYFLSYKPDLDFNADAQADYSIVDAPVTLAELRRDDTNKPRDITLADIGKAFEWAKEKGKLEQPLVVIFVDHGLPNELLLNPLGTETLTAETFKALLDDYQNSTNNQVVVILEACHSGTFVPTLAAPNRLIVSSTDAELAYFSDTGRTSFLKLYFDNLRSGESFGNSLKPVTDVFAKLSWPLNQQRPQLNDNQTTKNLCLNGCWGGLPGVLTLIPQIPSGQINLGQPIDLTVQTNISSVGVKQVWASMITPEIASQRNEQGYSLQPAPFIPLSLQSTNTRKNDKKWQGSFSKFTIPGDYVVTFRAKDNKGFITDAPPVILTVTGEGLTHASFNATTNIVHIPAVTVGTDIYQADLLVRQFEPEIILEVDMNSLQLADDTTTVGYSNFTPGTGEVYIPLLEVPNATGGIDTYSVNLQLEPQASPLQFKVKSLK